MKYRRENEKNENLVTHIFEIGEKEKVMKPSYDDESRQKLLRVIREFESKVTEFDLWTNTNANEVYRLFRNTINGSARDSWDNIIDGEIKAQADFEVHQGALIDKLLRSDAYKNQLQYLKRTVEHQIVRFNQLNWTMTLSSQLRHWRKCYLFHCILFLICIVTMVFSGTKKDVPGNPHKSDATATVARVIPNSEIFLRTFSKLEEN